MYFIQFQVSCIVGTGCIEYLFLSTKLTLFFRPKKQDETDIKPEPNIQALSSLPLMEPPKAPEHFKTPDISIESSRKSAISIILFIFEILSNLYK